MILRIIIFGMVFVTAVVARREFPLEEKIKALEFIFCGGFLSITWHWEIHSRIREGATQKQIRWVGYPANMADSCTTKKFGKIRISVV